MTDNVHTLQLVTLGENAVIPADHILERAKASLIEAIVIGRDKDGELYFAATHGCASTLWLIEKAKAVLLGMNQPGRDAG